MLRPEDVLLQLAQRFDLLDLAGDPELARAALEEELPDNPGTAALLTAAVEHGAAGALAYADRNMSYETLAPQLVADLREGSGLDEANARRAVDAWATALGRSVASSPSPSTSSQREEARAAVPMVSLRKTEPSVTQDTDEPTPVVADEPQSRATGPKPRSASPTAAPRRFRRRLAVLLAATALVLLVLGGATALIANSRTQSLTVAGDAASATVNHGGSTSAVRADETPPRGSTVTVSRGTLELTVDHSVVRVREGSRIRVDGPAAIRLLQGRAFVHAADDTVVVRSRAGAAAVRNGRMFVNCSDPSACRTTAVEEPVAVQRPEGRVALRPHQALTAAGDRSYTLPDSFRSDPWVRINETLDHREHRGTMNVRGPSVLGGWTLRIGRAGAAAPEDHTVTFIRSCRASGCTIKARAGVADGSATGTVHALSSDGTVVSVDYDRYPAHCPTAPGTAADGAEEMSDRLTLTSFGTATALIGTREARYIPKGATCSSKKDRAATSSVVRGVRTPAR